MSHAKHERIRLKFFLHILEQKHYRQTGFSGTSKKSNLYFGEIHPGAGMTAFQKYRSNPYRIVRNDTVLDTEALNAARIETGAASATCCSTSSNVNRAKA
jgi:hypothetical protein